MSLGLFLSCWLESSSSYFPSASLSPSAEIASSAVFSAFFFDFFFFSSSFLLSSPPREAIFLISDSFNDSFLLIFLSLSLLLQYSIWLRATVEWYIFFQLLHNTPSSSPFIADYFPLSILFFFHHFRDAFRHFRFLKIAFLQIAQASSFHFLRDMIVSLLFCWECWGRSHSEWDYFIFSSFMSCFERLLFLLLLSVFSL